MKKLDEILEFLFHTKRGLTTLVLGGLTGTCLLGGCAVTDCFSLACDDTCDGCYAELDDCVNDCVSCGGDCDNTIFTALFGAGCTSECGDCAECTLSCNFSDYDCGCETDGCSDRECSFAGYSCSTGSFMSSYVEPHISITILYYDINTGETLGSSSATVYESSSYINVNYSSYSTYECYGVYTKADKSSSNQIAGSTGTFVSGKSYSSLSAGQTVYYLVGEYNYGEEVTLKFSATVDGENIRNNSDFDGIGISGSSTVRVGYEISGVPSASALTPEGYEFKGWYYNGSLVTTLKNGNTFRLSDYGTTDTTLSFVAVYETQQLDVTFMLMSGESSSILSGSTVSYGTTIGDLMDSINDTVEENLGKLLGLATSKSAKDYLSKSYKITEDMTLYVFYNELVNITLYNADGPDSGTTAVTGYFLGDTYTLSVSGKNGYYFAGWYTDSSLSECLSTYTITLTNTSYRFYAGWSTESQVRIEYYVSGTLVHIQYYSTETSSSLLTDVDDMPTGYELKGWYTSSSLTGTPITSTANLTGTMKLYAAISAKEYTINLNANGGTISSPTTTVTYGSDYKLSIPTRSGYTFEGWYYGDIKCTDNNGNSLAAFTEDALGTLSEDVVNFTAKWTQIRSAATYSDLTAGGEERENEIIVTKIKDEEY